MNTPTSHSRSRVLCIYATRQIDSNLFMSSTIFNGLKKGGFQPDIIFAGTKDVLSIFHKKYSHYFNKVYDIELSSSRIKRYLKNDFQKTIHSFLQHFITDNLIRPYSKRQLKSLKLEQYQYILSFVPPPISGLLAHDIQAIYNMQNTPLIQYWTDPLSLGRCNDITDIPPWRYFHKKLEHKILGFADKIVFCYPLLSEMEQKLHPAFAKKMTWSDVSYIERSPIPHVQNNQISVGLFGAYQKRVRNITPLLNTLHYFPEIKFILRGDSDISIDPANYPNLDIETGRRPAEEIEILENKCDILLSLGGLSGITHPAGKTFYYANYDKPIVYIGDGQHKKYFEDYLSGFEDRYIICENTVESIRKGIKKALDILPVFKLKIPLRMKPEIIAQKILSLSTKQ